MDGTGIYHTKCSDPGSESLYSFWYVDPKLDIYMCLFILEYLYRAQKTRKGLWEDAEQS